VVISGGVRSKSWRVDRGSRSMSRGSWSASCGAWSGEIGKLQYYRTLRPARERGSRERLCVGVGVVC